MMPHAAEQAGGSLFALQRGVRGSEALAQAGVADRGFAAEAVALIERM